MALHEAMETTSASTGLGAASRLPSTSIAGPPAGPPRQRIPPSHATSTGYSTGTPSGIVPSCSHGKSPPRGGAGAGSLDRPNEAVAQYVLGGGGSRGLVRLVAEMMPMPMSTITPTTIQVVGTPSSVAAM